MDTTAHLTSIWKDIHHYGRIIKDFNSINYRLLTYLYNGKLIEVRLERGQVTRIEVIL